MRRRWKPLSSWHLLLAFGIVLFALGITFIMIISALGVRSLGLSDPLGFFIWVGLVFLVAVGLVWWGDQI